MVRNKQDMSGSKKSSEPEDQVAETENVDVDDDEPPQLRAVQEPKKARCKDCGHVSTGRREIRKHWERCFITRLEKAVEERHKLKAAQSALEAVQPAEHVSESQKTIVLSDDDCVEQLESTEAAPVTDGQATYNVPYSTEASVANNTVYIPNSYESTHAVAYNPADDDDEEVYFEGLFPDSPQPMYELESHQAMPAIHHDQHQIIPPRVDDLTKPDIDVREISGEYEISDITPTIGALADQDLDIEIIGMHPPRYEEVIIDDDIDINELIEWERKSAYFTSHPLPVSNTKYSEIKRTPLSPTTSEFSSNPSSSSEEPIAIALHPEISWDAADVPHILCQQPMVAPDNPNRLYCEVCGRSISRRHFVVHYRMHIDQKPFKCKFCGQSFRTTSSLKVHERKHTGERPYVCSLCSYKAVTKNNLNRHRFNVHFLNEQPEVAIEEPPIIQRQKLYRAKKLQPKELAKAERDRHRMVPIDVSGENEIRVAIL